MKRAYPEYLSAVAGQLPRQLLEVVYPLDHWTSIKRYASAQKLDPYLVAGLINQESTFDPVIKSSAGAIGSCRWCREPADATRGGSASGDSRPPRSHDPRSTCASGPSTSPTS